MTLPSPLYVIDGHAIALMKPLIFAFDTVYTFPYYNVYIPLAYQLNPVPFKMFWTVR